MNSRRSIIKRGLLGGALLTLGGSLGLAFRKSAKLPAPVEGLLVFTPREHAIVEAIALRFLAGAPGLTTARVGLACDRLASRADLTAQVELRQLLQLFENALPNFLFGGRWLPFTRQTPEEQDETLREWRGSRLTVRRSGYTALRTMAMGAYYSNPKTWPFVHYPGPPVAFHDPNAPVWNGEGPRPPGNGVWVEPSEPAEAPEP
jgi:hypothetical protein